MITPPWKKLGLTAIAVVLITAIFYFKTRSQKADPSPFINPAFAEYITSYTTGVVPSKSNLTISFSRDMVDSGFVGKEVSEKLFEFSPAISGSTVWLDTRTVQFRPEHRMSSGEFYAATFYLSRVAENVPDELRHFRYPFQVIPQNFDVQILNTKVYDETELGRQKIEGHLQNRRLCRGEERGKYHSGASPG